jgi:hypothetical protein
MLSITTWIVALIVSVGVTVWIAGAGEPQHQLIACAVIALLMTANAIRENLSLVSAGAPKTAVAGSTARNAGLVWAWGALSILLTYQLAIAEPWPEWWHFFLGFAIAAVGSMVYARTMERDEATGRVDEGVLKIGRALVWAQAIGVAAGLVSMFVDGKFPRASSYADWAGCNIFFFGGLAIMLISLNALRSSR